MDGSTLAIILAAISFLASLTGNVLQFLNDKKKTNNDAMSQLISKVLEMNKQELDVVRLISDDIRTQLLAEIAKNKELTIKQTLLESELRTAKKERDTFKERLDNIESLLNGYPKLKDKLDKMNSKMEGITNDK